MTNLQVLTFGRYYNQPLIKFFDNKNDKAPENNHDYFLGRPLDNSLSTLINLQVLTFGKYFNQPLDNCLSNLVNLRELTLGANFNQQVNIPDGIKKLVLNCNLQNIIDYLPSSIEELVLGDNFNSELNNLPSSIKKIKIENDEYDKKLNNLPSQIEILVISSEYKVSIDAKYKNLKITYL